MPHLTGLAADAVTKTSTDKSTFVDGMMLWFSSPGDAATAAMYGATGLSDPRNAKEPNNPAMMGALALPVIVVVGLVGLYITTRKK